MREINPKGVKTQSKNVLILQENPKQQLVKVNRYLLYLVAVLMTLVVVMGFLLVPSENPLATVKTPIIQAQKVTPVLSDEINLLKSQMTGLVSGSIESKLRTLEESVRAGRVNNALEAIQDLKRDVRMLPTHSVSAVAVSEPAKVANDVLLEEVSHLKKLIYLTLASVSLMVTAVACVWVKRRHQLTHQRTAYIPQERQ